MIILELYFVRLNCIALCSDLGCDNTDNLWEAGALVGSSAKRRQVLCLQLFNDIKELQYHTENTITNCRIEQQKTCLHGEYFEIEVLD